MAHQFSVVLVTVKSRDSRRTALIDLDEDVSWSEGVFRCKAEALYHRTPRGLALRVGGGVGVLWCVCIENDGAACLPEDIQRRADLHGNHRPCIPVRGAGSV